MSIKVSNDLGGTIPPKISAGLLFGKVFPEADGHVLTLLAGIGALGDGNCVEVGAPQALEQPLVGVNQFIGKTAGGYMREVGRKSDNLGTASVIVIPVAASLVVDEKPLGIETVDKMVDSDGQDVVNRLHDGKIGAIGGLLEAQEHQDAVTLAAHIATHVGDGEYVGIVKSGIGTVAITEYLADVAEKHDVKVGLLAEKTRTDCRESLRRHALTQPLPYPRALGVVGGDFMEVVAEHRRQISVTYYRRRKHPAVESVKDGCKHTLESAVIAANHALGGIGIHIIRNQVSADAAH